MRHPIRARLGSRAALLAVPVALAIGLAALPAQADETSTDDLAAAKAKVTWRIDKRLRTLDRLDTVVDAAKRLADGHQATLSDLIDADIEGLTALRDQVAAETTREALRADAQSMVYDYRIYILVRPQVRLTIAADRLAAALDRLTEVHAKLTDLVAQVADAGKDVENAEELLDAIQSQLDSAAENVEGQADAVLAIEPGPDGAGIVSAVDEVRESLLAARQDLRDALVAAKEIREILHGLQG